MIFSGNKWSEGDLSVWLSIANEDIMNDDLDLLVIPQYGRNPNLIG